MVVGVDNAMIKQKSRTTLVIARVFGLPPQSKNRKMFYLFATTNCIIVEDCD